MGVVGVRVGLTERGLASGRMVLSSNMVVLLSLHRVVVRQASPAHHFPQVGLATPSCTA